MTAARCGRGGWLCGPACREHIRRALLVPAWQRQTFPSAINPLRITIYQDARGNVVPPEEPEQPVLASGHESQGQRGRP